MITKKTNDFSGINFSEGEVLLIDKDKGISSFGVIRRLRKILGVKKIGHAGTLDPAATGLLILCTGRKTKEIYKYQGMDKTYSGIIRLGQTTPSMDSETEVENEMSTDGITEIQIEEVRKSFLGKTEQIPPMYSALKHKGKALYKLARKGQVVERKPREIIINEFVIDKFENPFIHFTLNCSKGTYVRVIADDFGKKLGCGAYLLSLRRDAIGEYKAADAYTVDELEKIFNSPGTFTVD